MRIPTEILHCIKPSETICPANVAVTLALCPEQINAIANTTAAAIKIPAINILTIG